MGHSITEEYQGANSKRIDFYPFLNGILTPVSVEHNMRSAQVCLDVAGKPEKNWSVNNLADAFEV